MGRYWFVVNSTKKEYFDVLHKQSELADDTDLWNQFIALMITRWHGDQIEIISDIDEDAYWDNYKKIKVNRD